VLIHVCACVLQVNSHLHGLLRSHKVERLVVSGRSPKWRVSGASEDWNPEIPLTSLLTGL
jgi:hypothetical protein